MRPLLLILFAPLVWSQTEDVTAKVRRAAELVVDGKTEEAIPIYEELAHAFPGDPGILTNLAIAEFKAKRYSDATVHARAVLKIQPDSLAANLFLGSSYEELGEHAMALDPLNKVLAVQPRERNARFMLAEALLNLERYEEAAAQFHNARDLAPENPKGWYGLGRAYEGLAEGVFRELKSASPESPYWHTLAADLYLRQRRYGSAFAHYRLALDGPVTLADVHAGLATIYERTGHRSWAQTEHQRELQSAPDCGKGGLACDFAEHHFHAIVQAARSSSAPETRYWAYKAYVAMASESYAHLLELPPSLEAHLHKAKAMDDGGFPGEAAVEWREALKLIPGDVRIGTALAWSLFRAHEFSAALPILMQLLQKERGSRDLHFLCGAIFVNLDQPEKAIAPLQAAIRLDDTFLPAHAALGQALLQTGKADLAIPQLKAAIPGDEDGSTHFALFRAYQLTGQTNLAAQAKTEYQMALQRKDAQDRQEETGTITAP